MSIKAGNICGKGTSGTPIFSCICLGGKQSSVRVSDTLQKVSLEALGFVSLWVDTLIGQVILLGILGNKQKIICKTHFPPIRQEALMSVTKNLER